MMSFANPRSATLFEQAVVSATGFLTMIFFARHLSTADWAAFSFAAGLLLVAQGMQLSVVILPMISFSKGALLSRQDQADWTWVNRSVLATMLAVAILAAGLVHWQTSSWMAASCLYAALLIPPAFTYEHLRRRLILSGRFNRLAIAGLAWALGVALGVLGNYRFGGSPLAAALSTWPGMLLALCVAGSHEPVRWTAPTKQWLRPLRSFAPSAAGSSLAMAGYSVAIQALLGGMSGAQALASFNATRMLVQPVNTLIGAFNNLDMPNSAKAFAEGGRSLIRFQARSVLRLGAIGGLYLLAVGIFAEPLLAWLFNGRYSQSDLAWSWVLVGLLMLVVTPTENTFYVTGRTTRLLASRLCAAAVGCSLAYFSIPHWGAVGGVLGVAAGWSTALIGGLAALWAVRNQGPAARLI
jgi:O-antigen/teichoic acid export membrane protein